LPGAHSGRTDGRDGIEARADPVHVNGVLRELGHG